MQIERRLSITHKAVEIQVHCYCRCPDEGEKMVTCDGDYGIIYSCMTCMYVSIPGSYNIIATGELIINMYIVRSTLAMPYSFSS